MQHGIYSRNLIALYERREKKQRRSGVDRWYTTTIMGTTLSWLKSATPPWIWSPSEKDLTIFLLYDVSAELNRFTLAALQYELEARKPVHFFFTRSL